VVFKEEPCVVICNGPSLNSVYNNELDQFYTLGSNRLYLRYNPDLLGICDQVMVHSPELQIAALEAFELSEEVVLSAALKKFFYNDVMPDNVFWSNWANPKKDGELLGLFSVNPDEILVSGGTVTYGLLQLALAKGYNKILIVGMDHTFMGPEGDHFSEEYNEPVGIPYNEEVNARYGLGAGFWPFSERQFVDKTNTFFSIAKRVFEENDGWIRNCSSYTECEVFETDKWENYA